MPDGKVSAISRPSWGMGLSALLHGGMLALLLFLGHLPASAVREIEQATPVTLVPQLADAGAPAQQSPGPPQEKAADLPHHETVTPPPAPPAPRSVAVSKTSVHHEAPRQKADDFSSRLQSLAKQVKAPSSALSAQGTGVSSRVAGEGEVGAVVGRSLKDIVRVQIERHWEYDFSKLGPGELLITLKLLVKPDGEVLRVELLDDPRFSGRSDYAPCAASARRAALAAASLQLPPGMVGDAVEVTVTLDPKKSLR